MDDLTTLSDSELDQMVGETYELLCAAAMADLLAFEGTPDTATPFRQTLRALQTEQARRLGLRLQACRPPGPPDILDRVEHHLKNRPEAEK